MYAAIAFSVFFSKSLRQFKYSLLSSNSKLYLHTTSSDIEKNHISKAGQCEIKNRKRPNLF